MINLLAARKHSPDEPRVVGCLRRGILVSQVNAGSIHGPRDAFIHEGEGILPLHVSGVELIDLKSRRRHKIIDLAVEMTATAEAFPTGCQTMLPPCDPRGPAQAHAPRTTDGHLGAVRAAFRAAPGSLAVSCTASMSSPPCRRHCDQME